MGRYLFSDYDYNAATSSRGINSASHHVTAAAEEKVKQTGKLDPAVDPGVDPIRRSLMRFDPMPDGRWEVTIGCPMNIESHCDTTGSMGKNVDIAMKSLPDTYALVAKMLPGYDPQLCLGIFGDYLDDFILNRPQFEMTADKIVDYLTKMNPEYGGYGNEGEDPQYGAFAAAYLTDAYTNRIGLKGYHFVITDEPCHRRISVTDLERVFSKDLWSALADNGHSEIDKKHIPDIQDIYIELDRKLHAFAILVGVTNHRYHDSLWRDWEQYYQERIICIDTTKDLPAVQAALVGYTEGTLEPIDVKEYLSIHHVHNARSIAEDICRQEFAKQRELAKASGMKIPKAGDIFARKTDAQPISDMAQDETAVSDENSTVQSTETWL